MDSVSIFLVGVAGLLLAGVLSEVLFERTRVPDAIWLILLGIVIGPVFNLIDKEMVFWVLQYFAALTLIVILFEGGRKLSLMGVRENLSSSLLLAVSTFSISCLAVALASWIGALSFVGLFTNWSWTHALMLGSIVGGSSSIILMPTLQFSKVKSNLTNTLSLESSITDAFCILGAIIFLNMTKSQSVSVIDGSLTILSQSLGLGLGLGLMGGVVALILLPFKKGKYAYTLAFSFLVLFYVAVTQVGGNGAIAILIVAIMMGNAPAISRLFKLGGYRVISEDVDFLHQQLSFIFKTFFFILIGFFLRPPLLPILLGFIFALILILAREGVCRLILRKSSFPENEKKLIFISSPRGLAAGVLASLPLAQNIPGIDRNFTSLVFSVIIFTTLYFAVRFSLLNRNGELQEKTESQSFGLP